ncbi:unnamed protein product [Cladocopium goreaui]|uniref:Uncharacterized protein n=1 Tax=Cladocopium goreaui TaxID=2562237 RepID=A0A9P1C853_9DINO|nr:unnamed protein product [Cladocopium goreaui]
MHQRHGLNESLPSHPRWILQRCKCRLSKLPIQQNHLEQHLPSPATGYRPHFLIAPIPPWYGHVAASPAVLVSPQRLSAGVSTPVKANARRRTYGWAHGTFFAEAYWLGGQSQVLQLGRNRNRWMT